MANRSYSTGLDSPQQNEVNNNFFFGGKRGVKFKKLGASRFFDSFHALFGIQLHYSLQQIIQDVEIMRRWLFSTWKGPIFSNLAMISYLARCQYLGVPLIFSNTVQGSSS